MSVLNWRQWRSKYFFTEIILLQDAYYLHHFISSQKKMIVKGQGHWLYRGQILSHHICSNKLNKKMEVTRFLRPHLNIIWDVKFFNLSQIHGCSTLTGKYPLSQMLAYHLRKILIQQFVPGSYPVIVEGNLFYYVKLKCYTPMRVIIPLTTYVRGRERINKNRQREFNQTCTRKYQNIFQSRSGWKYKRRFHCQVCL